MNDFLDDVLARRLATLEIAEPQPAVITARVLSSAPERHVPRPLAISAWTATLLLIGTLAAAYFAPAWSQALADGPIGGFAGGLLRGFGLASESNRVTVLSDRVSASGVTLELVGGYADGTRTLILLRTSPAAYPGMGSTPTRLRDQFGQSYNVRSAGGNIETGETILQFEPLRWPATAVGARVTVEIAHMLVAGKTDVSGPWSVHGTLSVEEGVDLEVPSAVDLGGLRLTFTRARSFSTTVVIDFRASGAIELLTQRVSGANPKGTPAVEVALIDDSGRSLTMVQGDLTGGGPELTGQWLWQVDAHAPYTLRISVAGVGRADRIVGP